MILPMHPDLRDGGEVVARPALWERLGARAQVTVVSARAGSGKTLPLRSWISQAALADRAAWVPVERGEQDPQRFWLSVLDQLRRTVPGSALVRTLTAAPELDGWAIVERLLTDLADLQQRLWLVIDDLHELGADARRQLELLVLRAGGQPGRDGQSGLRAVPGPVPVPGLRPQFPPVVRDLGRPDRTGAAPAAGRRPVAAGLST
jgi:hypothetical protein